MKIGNTRARSAAGVGLFWALFALFFSRDFKHHTAVLALAKTDSGRGPAVLR